MKAYALGLRECFGTNYELRGKRAANELRHWPIRAAYALAITVIVQYGCTQAESPQFYSMIPTHLSSMMNLMVPVPFFSFVFFFLMTGLSEFCISFVFLKSA